ncbi:MAG: glycosyltransferase family 2 protein [Bacteriovoracaceae bacterium]|nr:glycosyltransferase family 2 protein [Bacteriovoracaceae bacterium]
MKSLVTSVSVICPVFNEEKMISLFYEKLKNTLDTLDTRYDWQIIFVLDKSSDRSLEELEKIAAQNSKVQILSLSSRFGHQMSLVAGIDHVNTDVIIMMDSDLQHPPELIPNMLLTFENGYDIVYTIRNVPQNKSFINRMGSQYFYKILNLISEIKLSSGEADFRLISRRVAEIFRHQIRERNQFLRGLFQWVGFNKVGIHYDALPRAIGESKYNWARIFTFALSGITSFSKRPLQYAIVSGLLFSLLGLIFIVIVIANYFMDRSIPSGWSTLSILICVFGGIQLFFLGILGEYIGAIFDEVKGRPLYIVERKINFP